MNLEDKLQSRFKVVMDNILIGKDPGSTEKTINPVVKRIRKKSWFANNITGPVIGYTVEKVIAVGKKAGKNIAAEKFIDAVISDMDKRGLLKDDC